MVGQEIFSLGWYTKLSVNISQNQGEQNIWTDLFTPGLSQVRVEEKRYEEAFELAIKRLLGQMMVNNWKGKGTTEQW